ncbi:hypothetical protein J2S13_002746 [Oikeobacillus pervagus]|uniref:Oxalate:formate antiporter n=1 Tax=Oikeobacillus pervagus TaxID=1325931 RepID=A0AAJ1T822_9BACI|nr:hypothetical protein [Oikeobacillus pervagus]MDQ0216305.1 hypothetical protein [Oikeobacillus pervagus]
MKGSGSKEIIYIHLNIASQYTMSFGIVFRDFVKSLSTDLNNVLLLKHQFDDSDFNMHTLLDYVEKENIHQLLKEDVYEYGDFCWMDFEDTDGLNELEAQEIAELLYLGHSKQHLREPFYSKLNNQYVYLSHDDGWFNKIYYRYIQDFYHILGNIVALKLSRLKSEKAFFYLKKGKDFPSVPTDIIASFKEKMKEGMVISLSKAVQTRTRVEIPVWVVGDYVNMDEMYDDYTSHLSQPPSGQIVFDKKTREWSTVFR